MSSRQRPQQWPADVQFITATCFHPSVPAATRMFITNGANASAAPKLSDAASAVNPVVRIKYIADASHPARGQYGLFAVKKIPPRSHIIDYIGEVHCQDRPHSDYDLSLYRSQDGENVGVDACRMGNESRFVNDYRGIRSKPNAVFVEYRTVVGELRMSIWSAADPIKKGDEILVSYGKSWWRSRAEPN